MGTASARDPVGAVFPFDFGFVPSTATHRSIKSLNDLSPDLIAQIEHFFVSDNSAKGKQFKVKRRAGQRRALTLVKNAAIKTRR